MRLAMEINGQLDVIVNTTIKPEPNVRKSRIKSVALKKKQLLIFIPLHDLLSTSVKSEKK